MKNLKFSKFLKNASRNLTVAFRGHLEEKIKRLGSCSASLSGGNQVDGLPPALHTKAVSASWESQGSATIGDFCHFDVNLEKI